MTTRLLPPEEWPRLAGTTLETTWPLLPTETAMVVVVEDGEQIVACWALFPVWHAEGVYVREGYRLGAARRLLRGMGRVMRSLGITSVVTASCSEQVTAMLQRLGAEPTPGTTYRLDAKGWI